MSRPDWDDTWLDVARTVAKRSLCERDQVGAVIVDTSNRIIDTGYNNPPAGFQRHPTVNEDKVYCTMWCPRARQAHENQMQRKQLGNIGAFEPPLAEDYSDCPSLHAEANALMFGDRSQRAGGTIYVTSHMCMGCAKLVANSGLATVVVSPSAEFAHRNADASYTFLESCGITVIIK